MQHCVAAPLNPLNQQRQRIPRPRVRARGRVRKTLHQRATAQHLSFGLRLTSEPVSQVVEDIKNRRSEKIKISSFQSGGSKSWGAQSPRRVFPSSSLSLFPSHLESPPQVTALFNDAICLMPSRRLSARLALSLVSPVSPRRPFSPGHKRAKEPRPERRCSRLRGRSPD